MYRSFIDRLLLPAIFGLTTIVIALTFWQLLLSHSRAEIQSAAKEQASFVKTKTESELRARILPLERLALRWQSRDRSDEDMEADAWHAQPGPCPADAGRQCCDAASIMAVSPPCNCGPEC